MTDTLERIVLKKLRLLVPESSHWIKNSKAKNVKALNGNVSKNIWTHINTFIVNDRNLDDGGSAERDTRRTKNIRRFAGKYPVSELEPVMPAKASQSVTPIVGLKNIHE